MGAINSLSFRGKVALVTGSSRGIGRACAESLASLGCNLALTHNQHREEADELVRALSGGEGRVRSYRVDVSNVTAIRELFQAVSTDFGGLDILINGAGISQVVDALAITEQDWDRMMSVNLKGTFFACQEALKIMIPRKSGRIVNLASTAGQMGGFIVGVNYSSSKAGVICLTKSLAKYAAPHGITVNCLAPGLIDTDMVNDYPESSVSSMVASIPLGRMGRPQEVSDAAVFLASDAASYITGSTVYVNGGTYLG